jgi:copper(I)-binding protein
VLRKLSVSLIWLFLIASSVQAEKQFYIDNAWIESSRPGTSISAGFMTITNKGTVSDRLIAVETGFAVKVELHSVLMVDEVMSMRPLRNGLVIPPAGVVKLSPATDHMMFIGLKKPLMVGETRLLVLSFEKTGKLTVAVPVK